jgi:hypothetical protein
MKKSILLLTLKLFLLIKQTSNLKTKGTAFKSAESSETTTLSEFIEEGENENENENENEDEVLIEYDFTRESSEKDIEDEEESNQMDFDLLVMDEESGSVIIHKGNFNFPLTIRMLIRKANSMWRWAML